MSYLFNDENKNQRPLSKIHIHMRTRNKKKCFTTIEGLAPDLDYVKILKYLRRALKTNGTIFDSEDGTSKIIQLQGDKREEVKNFFEMYNIWEEPDPKIVVHGIKN